MGPKPARKPGNGGSVAVSLSPTGDRSDDDEALPVSGPDEPVPAWLVEDWPGPKTTARIDALRRQKEHAAD